ncbi:MAG: hypothetical protein ACRCUA_07295 [Fusobacteriaceae bacterium]
MENSKSRRIYINSLKMTDSELLEDLREFLIKNNSFTSIAYRKLKFINFATLKKRFKIHGWKNFIDLLSLEKEYEQALIKSKLEKNKTLKRIVVEENPEELLKLYKSFSNSIGVTNGASMSELKKYGFKYSEKVLLKRFGSWKNLKLSAGYEFKMNVRYSKDEIIESMLKARKKYGRRLSQNEIIGEKTLPALDTIFNCFQCSKISLIWDELEKNLKKTSVIKKRYSF